MMGKTIRFRLTPSRMSKLGNRLRMSLSISTDPGAVLLDLTYCWYSSSPLSFLSVSSRNLQSLSLSSIRFLSPPVPALALPFFSPDDSSSSKLWTCLIGLLLRSSARR